MEKRKVFFSDGVDFMLIITDAPKEVIEAWCFRYKEAVENGTYGDGKEVQLFDTLKASYYVKELLDSVVDVGTEDIDIIGYDETYDMDDYTPLRKRIPGFRTIKFFAGMTGEFEIISTNAPDAVIIANMKYINVCEESGEQIHNPYAVIEAMGYVANCIGSHDDINFNDLENAIIDESFDYYDI